jgi:DNA replication protein DnaC
MTDFKTPTQVIREYLLSKYDPAFAKREGIEEMTGSELIQWLKANAPDRLAEAVRSAYGIPRIEAAAERFGVDPDELQAHCDAGDVEEWLASQGHVINPVAVATELTPEQLRRRMEASKSLAGAGLHFEYHADVRDGVLNSGQTFHNFDQRPGTKLAYDAVLAWVRGTGKPILTLKGEPGAGKTHLLMAAAITLRDRGDHVIYRTDDQFYRDWRRTFDGGPDAPGAFQDADWFVLDDAWRSAQTDWAAGTLDGFIDYRYERQMRTLIATNVEPTGRLYDRLTDVMVSRYIEMTASSIRQQER